MTVEEAVLARALDSSAVTTIAGDRGYGTRFDQEQVYPAFLVRLVVDPRNSHLRGPDGSQRAQVQIDCADQEQSGRDATATARSLAVAIMAAISPEPFTIGSPLMEVKVPLIDRRETYDPDDRRVVRVILDSVCWYRSV